MIEYDVFQDGKRFALTMSFDDNDHDEKLVALFNKYGIKGTFHLISNRCDYSKTAEIYKGHEISCHGMTHRSMTYIPTAGLVHEIFKNRAELEAVAGYPVVGLSYPNGCFSDEVITALKNLGIVYSRTVHSTHSWTLPEDFMKWNPTCHYKECIEEGKRFLDSFDGYFPFPKLLYVWGHAFELENNGHWEMMEEFCRMMSKNKRIWYATNIEIYRYVTAQRNLCISADEAIVYNPSGIPVWFSKDGTVYKVEPNETLTLK